VGVRSCRKQGESAARGAASRRPRPALSLARAADYTALPQTFGRRRDATPLVSARAGLQVAQSGKRAPGDAAPPASTRRDRPVANEDSGEAAEGRGRTDEGTRRRPEHPLTLTASNRTISSPIMNIRRLPGFMYHHKLATLLLAFALLLVYLLLHWGVMCTNLEAWRHVSTVVSQIAPIGERSTARSRHAALSIRRISPFVERSDAGLRGDSGVEREVRGTHAYSPRSLRAKGAKGRIAFHGNS